MLWAVNDLESLSDALEMFDYKLHIRLQSPVNSLQDSNADAIITDKLVYMLNKKSQDMNN